MSDVKIALIRGINVGKAKRVAMEDLRRIIEKLGCSNVRTLLNSGNAVFNSPNSDTCEISTGIENAIFNELGISAKVIVLAEDEIVSVMEDNSLREVADNPSRLLVAIPRNAEDLNKLKTLEEQNWESEHLAVGRRAAYLWCPNGILESKVAEASTSLLGEGVTTRNWATMLKIYGICK